MVLVADPWAALIKWHSLWSICPGFCAVNGGCVQFVKTTSSQSVICTTESGYLTLDGVMTVMSIIIKAGDQKSVVVGKILQQMNDLSTEDPFILVKIIIIKFWMIYAKIGLYCNDVREGGGVQSTLISSTVKKRISIRFKGTENFN